MEAGVPDIIEEYSLFQPSILDRLDNRKWFIECMAFNFYSIGSEWSSFAETSERRLGETYDFWKVDAQRTLNSGIEKGTEKLDHFKQASFIAFWLRRQIPINRTLRLHADGAVAGGRPYSSEQEFFFRYGNEICALLIGLELCLYYEVWVKLHLPPKEARTLETIADDRRGYAAETTSALEYIRGCRLKRDCVRDFAMVLKHKNMSPHALYLLYKSLFTNLQAPSPKPSKS
jgi:hypothetical protein